MYTLFYRLLQQGDLKTLKREFVKYAREQGKEYGDEGYKEALATLNRAMTDFRNSPPLKHPFTKYTDRSKKWGF